MKTNYQLILDAELQRIVSSGGTPSLLLHSCCGPCSSYVLEYLARYFRITVLYYNPNIWPESEFIHRAETQKQLLSAARYDNLVDIIIPGYAPSEFYAVSSGLEGEPEGGARCLRCFELRLQETAKRARDGGYDWFSTTLSVSPHKDAEALNRIGQQAAERYGVSYLCADFKKRDGYKRSIELSAQYGLYRQDYCGCEYSVRSSPSAQARANDTDN
ncbi:MAG: epoxyqueuosine reductase QueH [Oscillospiraceae bacterium]|nr:epoxyqueuosine reductase QueH [Oscillospiraceae bacterium]